MPVSQLAASPCHFNPLPPHGGRQCNLVLFVFVLYFNPLPPHGGRQSSIVLRRTLDVFQSTPSTRRETGDACKLWIFETEFQSTPSTRRETFLPWQWYRHSLHFNPLPPHGGRPEVSYTSVQESIISIHSLHTEGDETHLPHPSAKLLFQSTPSTRRETMRVVPYVLTDVISIHSLHTEGDMSYEERIEVLKNFNPLPPHGGRRMRSHAKKTITNFNPLPPHGGRHPAFHLLSAHQDISIHSLHTEGDC